MAARSLAEACRRWPLVAPLAAPCAPLAPSTARSSPTMIEAGAGAAAFTTTGSGAGGAAFTATGAGWAAGAGGATRVAGAG